MEYTTTVTNSQTHCPPTVDGEADRSMDSGRIAISLYENEIPPFVEAEMERLYQNVYTSLARFRIYGVAKGASTYVVRTGDRPTAIFLFRREQKKVHVLNEQITINEEEINRFADAIFNAYGSVTVISFWAIQTNIHRPRFPLQRWNGLSDIVLALPGSAEEYLASLGKSTRTNIRRRTKKLLQSFPAFSYEFYEKEKINEQHIRDIIGMNRARMAIKDKVANIDDKETERIINLARVFGLVGVATIDGHVCAGTICYCVGTNYFMHVIAHDPRYDDYRLGTHCIYLTICECIARGGKEYRFMESTHRYKFDFLGVWMDFDCLSIYRSQGRFLLAGGSILKTIFRAWVRRARLWLLFADRRADSISRITTRFMHALRNWKHAGYGFFASRK